MRDHDSLGRSGRSRGVLEKRERVSARRVFPALSELGEVAGLLIRGEAVQAVDLGHADLPPGRVVMLGRTGEDGAWLGVSDDGS